MEVVFTPAVCLDWQRGHDGLVAVTGDRVVRVVLCEGLWLWTLETYKGRVLEHGTEHLVGAAQDMAQQAFDNEI